MRMHRHHLRPALEYGDVCEYLAAVGGRGLAEHSVVVEAYVYGVGREARIQRHHDPGGQISSKRRRPEEDDRRAASLSQLCKRCLIWPRAVLLKRGIFGQNDLVRAAGQDRRMDSL